MYEEDEITGHGIPYTGTRNPYTGSQFVGDATKIDPWNVNREWPTIDYNEMGPAPDHPRYTDEMGMPITYEEWLGMKGFRQPLGLGEQLGKYGSPAGGQVPPPGFGSLDDLIALGQIANQSNIMQGPPSPTFGQNIKNFAGGLLDYIPKPLPHKPMPMYSGGELVENLQGPSTPTFKNWLGSGNKY
tara:strand:+ start:61 stop:618 length:558 start_codon:yes stop_codon:yes gene_type:complete